MRQNGSKNRSANSRFKEKVYYTVRRSKFDPIKTMLANMVYLTPYQQVLVSMRILNIMQPPTKGGLESEMTEGQTKRISAKSPMTPEEIDRALHNDYEPISPHEN